jgi:hypothetical protein
MGLMAVQYIIAGRTSRYYEIDIPDFVQNDIICETGQQEATV